MKSATFLIAFKQHEKYCTPMMSLEIDATNSEHLSFCKHQFFLIKKRRIILLTACPTCNISYVYVTTRAGPDAKRLNTDATLKYLLTYLRNKVVWNHASIQ